jgi:four helix bundle protein
MTNDKMTNDENRSDSSETSKGRVYDLEERSAVFGETVIRFCRGIPIDAVTTRIITQLVSAAGSVGANYCEGDDAVSRKEFRQKIGYCKKVAREAKHGLRMMAAAHAPSRDTARILWKEADELHRIFCAIWRRTRPE